MSIVLDEAAYAENAIKNCVLGDKPVETLSRVARYYKSQDYTRAEIGRLLEAFMLKCDPTTNIVKWQETIDQQVKAVDKYPLIKIHDIPVTRKELDVCDALSGKQMRRLMFTLICLAKFSDVVNSKNNGWVNRQDREIFKLANVVTPIKRQSLMLNDLREAGLIRFSRKVDNVNINVVCIDHNGDAVLHIDDFRNLGYQYMRYCGEPYFECANCGLVVRRSNNSQRYCAECGVEVHRRMMRETWRRNNNLLS